MKHKILFLIKYIIIFQVRAGRVYRKGDGTDDGANQNNYSDLKRNPGPFHIAVFNLFIVSLLS